jgi:LemA protein
MIAVWIILGLVVLVLISGIVIYNGLVRMKTKIENAYAQIDVQLTRRHDLIPNLVETVKGYASHEKETLDAVISARNMATSASGPADQAQAENVLSGALKSLFALAEAYPDLKANLGFQQLQTELAATEDRIAFSRQYYNDNVRIYDEKILRFPTVMIAGTLHFSKAEYFEADETQRTNVQVKFD